MEREKASIEGRNSMFDFVGVSALQLEAALHQIRPSKAPNGTNVVNIVQSRVYSMVACYEILLIKAREVALLSGQVPPSLRITVQCPRIRDLKTVVRKNFGIDLPIIAPL